MSKTLTDALIRSISSPANGRIELADAKATGLSLRITSNGCRSWCFRFRDPRSARTSRATLGEYPIVTLGEARTRAESMRRQVLAGENPIEQKRRERETAAYSTFQALANRYLEEHARRHKRSANADERNLRLHVLPRWGKRRYDDIARRDVIELVEGLVAAGKPTLANRVQALVSMVFSFAMDADLVKGNPCARLRRRGVERIARRILSDDEIRLFWSGILQKPVSQRVGRALQLILLTGVRPGEAAGIARAELENISEKGRARWIIPPARSKNQRSHLVPLSEPARQTVFSALETFKDDGRYLFPSPAVRNAPITAHALAVAMMRFANKLDPKLARSWHADPPSPHDLRRTVATRLSELGIAKEDRDAILNHAPRDIGRKHYDLYDREREKRRALDLWSSTLMAILHRENGDATVTPFSGASRKS